jgi:hypothetical protein
VPRFQHVRENGITFVFKMDEVDPTLLHIYARHTTSIDDALDMFFDTRPTWNLQFERYESFSETHGLYWFWLDEKAKVVMVVSCFRL